MNPARSSQPPRKTVHDFCHYCIQSRLDGDISNCGGEIVYSTGKPCPFYKYRNGKGRVSVKTFRAFCLECMGGSAMFVRECESYSCPIFSYRMGKSPAHAGKVFSVNLSSRHIVGLIST